MSDSTGQAGTRSVSMRKPTSRAPRPDIAKVTPPRTIDLATAAIGVLILGLIVRSVGLLGSTSTLIAYYVDANKTAKKPIANYTTSKAMADVDSLRHGALIQSAVVAVALVLLIFALRRTRGASGTRWAMLIIIVLTSLPFYVIPVKGWPPIPQAASVVTGLAALAVIVLLFVPQSQAYFRACRHAVNPQAAQSRPKPGLAGLFGPRQPRQPRGGFGARASAAASARTNPPTAPAASPSRGSSARGSSAKPRAKVRADADSVAKGAELARSRAKASKSRRTES